MPRQREGHNVRECYRGLLRHSDVPKYIDIRITKKRNSNLFGTVVLLSEPGSIGIILGLGHGVSTGGGLDPGISGVSSTLLVELGVVKELEGLLDVLVVVGSLLGSIFGTD